MTNKFLAHTPSLREELLKSINLSSIEDLFSMIPKQARCVSFELQDAKPEFEVQRELSEISKLNKTDCRCFIGGGAYKHFIPSAIKAVSERFEFLSAYTPYQAEISQGTLEVMYDFQTLICKLTNQDVSNASVYDGASACAEAILMSSRLCRGEGKNRAFVSKNLNPNYLEVVKTYLWANDMEPVVGDNNDKQGEFCCHLYQSPNYYGEIEETPEKHGDELIIACVNLTSLGILEPPRSDITVGDFQTLGLPLSFGGPYGGFIASRDEYKRQLPGRIVGKTIDKEENPAYVLTLQAREQHIRREKATSNICSNQALSALCATLYMDLTGEDDFVEISTLCAENAHTLAQGLVNKGYKILSNNFYNEFVLKVACANQFLADMKKEGILAGIKLSDDKVLVALTELNTKDDIDFYLKNV